MAIPGRILSPLADVLAELYSDQASIRAIALTADLTLGQIPVDLKPSNTWVFLLNEAEAQGCTQPLLDRARQQYPEEKRLYTARQAYDDWVAAGRPVHLRPQPLPTPRPSPPPPTRRIPAWVWAAAVGAVVVVLVVLNVLNGPSWLRDTSMPTVAPAVSDIPATNTPERVTTVPSAQTTPTTRPTMTPTAWQPPTSPIAFDWVEIPAGEFTMGSDPQQDKEARLPEQPSHPEFVYTFWIARTEVTVAQFAEFVKVTGYDFKDQLDVSNRGNHPVTGVSWKDAQAFSEWAGVRLPTEAEWEMAARGTDGRIYPWKNSTLPDKSRCNFGGNVGDTTAVGSYLDGASFYGLLDMCGNVFEWTQTKWRGDYKTPADNSLEGNEARVVRGGAFDSEWAGVRSAVRYNNGPDDRRPYLGFRVAASPNHP